MSVDQMVSVSSALIAFIGLLFVAHQIKDATKQRYQDSLYQIYDINRQLLSLGFSHPQLFNILTDAKNADPEWERRYLQMWLNQLSLIHAYLRKGSFDAEFHDSLNGSIAEFMTLQNMQRHWKQHSSFYQPSFQKLVNDIVSKTEAARPIAS